MNADVFEELQEAYLNNSLIPVLGAGVSMPFNLPDWGQLLRICANKHNVSNRKMKRLERKLEHYDYVGAADVILSAGVSEEALCQCVADTICEAKGQITDEDKAAIKHNYSDMAELFGVRYMTTNYDMYLNDYTGGQSFRITDLTRIPANRFRFKEYEKAIIPIHGEISDPRSIVLSRKSYKAVYNDEGFETAFQFIRSSFVFLFIGFSFDDAYVRMMFEHILNKRLPSKHYILFADSMQEKDPDKIDALKRDYGVVSIFYKTNGHDHSEGIREILHRITKFKDKDIDVKDLPKLRDEEEEFIPDNIKELLVEGEKAREREEVSRTEEIFKAIRNSEEYSALSAKVKTDVIANLIWCRGMVYDFDGANRYLKEAYEDEELKPKKARLAFMYAQTLWNLMKFEEAIEVLKDEGINESKTMLIQLFTDICEASKWRYKGKERDYKKAKVYEEQDWTEDYKAEAKQRYLTLRNKYVNYETYNLKEHAKYERNEDLEYAYYWLGHIAGQLFHEHEDAVQFINRAKEYHNRRSYDECLATNYLEIARHFTRYKKNTKAYQINKAALSKAWRCFKIAYRVEDEVLLQSMYRRTAALFLDCLFMMKRFYEFEDLWDKASGYMEKGKHEWLQKAEVDAQYMFRIDPEVVGNLSDEDKVYFKCVRLYHMAAYKRQQRDIAGGNRYYNRIIKYVGGEIDRKRTEPRDEEGIVRFLLLGFDAAFFVGNRDAFCRYKDLLEIYDRSGDSVREAMAHEIEGDWDGAETLLNEEYRKNPDVSTLLVLNGCYIRHAEKCQSEPGLSSDEATACRRLYRGKSHALYEEALAGKGALLFDEVSFYRGYILDEINIWRDIPKAMQLYCRFYERMKDEPDLLYELEEVLKQILFDFSDMNERAERNRRMLSISPLEVNHQFYRNMLNLYVANFYYGEVWNLWEEIIPKLKMSHPETAYEYHMLRILTMPCFVVPRSDGGMNCRYSFGRLVNIINTLHEDNLYKKHCFGERGKRLVLPLEVVFALHNDGRMAELDEFDTVFVPYSSSFALQNDLVHREFLPARAVLYWICNDENVKQFAPPIYDVASKVAEDSGKSIERIQIEVLVEQHQDVRFLFEEVLDL